MQVHQSSDVRIKQPAKKSQSSDEKNSDFSKALEDLAAYAVQPKAPEVAADPETLSKIQTIAVEGFSTNQLFEMMGAVTLQDWAKMAQGIKLGQMGAEDQMQMINPQQAGMIITENGAEAEAGVALQGNWTKAEGEAVELIETAADLLKAEPVKAEKQVSELNQKAIQSDETAANLAQSAGSEEKAGVGNGKSGFENHEKILGQEVVTARVTDYQMSEMKPVNTEMTSQPAEIKPEYADMLKDMIAKQVSSGKNELEIQLTPRSLGDLTVKVSYTDGAATVSIICTDKEALKAMSQRAEELGRILESNLGSKTEVVVESQKEQARLYEDGRGQQQSYNGQQSSKEQQSEKRQNETEVIDFLQQLRLGIRKENETLWQ